MYNIFLTSYGDKLTIEKASKTHPYGYLLKPIEKQHLFAAIEVAIKKFEEIEESAEEQKTTQIDDSKVKDSLFIKDEYLYVKVKYDELFFVQSFGEYVKLYTQDDVLLALQTTNFMEQMLPQSNFIRIHRSSIVNINHVKEIIGNEVLIDQHRLTISKRMKDAFMKRIQAKGVI